MNKGAGAVAVVTHMLLPRQILYGLSDRAGAEIEKKGLRYKSIGFFFGLKKWPQYQPENWPKMTFEKDACTNC